MALIRKALMLVAIVFIFTGCHEMTSDLEKTIGTTCWNEKLHWEDVSAKNDYSFSGSNGRFKNIVDNGEPAIEATSASGNWVLSGLGTDIKGYEVQVKCAANANLCGIQLYSSNDYRAFEVYIKKGGYVQVYFMHKNGKDKVSLFNKKILDDITVYNTISLELQDDRSLKVGCNGKNIYRIEGYSISYGLLTLQKSSPASTYYKIKKVLH